MCSSDLMVVGMEEGEETLSQLSPSHRFAEDDTIWVVGEKDDLERLWKANVRRRK